MIRTVVAGAFAASLLAGAAPSAFAQSRNPLSNVFNCDRAGSQQTPGALIGGALGGLAGAGVAKNDALGGILGAVVGAAAGSYIGCNLGGQDRASLEDATLQALNEGRNTTWNNPRTGASARINVMADTTASGGSSYGGSSYGGGAYAPRYGDRIAGNQLRLGTRVTNAAGFETVAPRQVALAQTLIRLSPSTRAPSNGSVSRGEELEVMAKVQGQPWLLVGRNGVGAGYIPQSSARPIAESVTTASAYGQTQPISAQSLRLRNTVAWAQAYESAPSEFTVRSNATLRASPSTTGRSLGMLYSGDEVEALARVRGGPWILVGRNGEGVGYVHDSLLEAQQSSSSPGYGAQPGYGSQPAYGQGGYTQASGDCRIVQQEITTPQQGMQTERLRACRTAQGTWAFTRL